MKKIKILNYEFDIEEVECISFGESKINTKRRKYGKVNH